MKKLFRLHFTTIAVIDLLLFAFFSKRPETSLERICRLSWSMTDQLPLSLIRKIDKKDQASRLGFSYLSQNIPKRNRFLISFWEVSFQALADAIGRDEMS